MHMYVCMTYLHDASKCVYTYDVIWCMCVHGYMEHEVDRNAKKNCPRSKCISKNEMRIYGSGSMCIPTIKVGGRLYLVDCCEESWNLTQNEIMNSLYGMFPCLFNGRTEGPLAGLGCYGSGGLFLELAKHHHVSGHIALGERGGWVGVGVMHTHTA